jgi:uncharacterized protein (TIGR00730 family)
MINHAVKRVCVYCGSSPGTNPEYKRIASELGSLLAEAKIDLVYGGASIGVMGSVADAVMAGGGHVTGIIPHGLFRREVAHEGISSLLVVDSMHERKALMAGMADALITLPGGYGTLEELFEMITWSQIGIHTKPIFLLNTLRFYNPLLKFIDTIIHEGFIKPGQQHLFRVAETPSELLGMLRASAAGTETPFEVRP